ncbi:hypothetical protein HYDPIDRAFT_111265 [Hydnomerulius pinastri MD-312]|uniref:FAD/NAD(P)-binding domain-containing protein n=1 Tax=Hydnomerulius pinastri MD-312 TaxID=994086 RepID=A0A0C9VGL8_9AGAM|nr:hypothetical protein HYDPIDRAFT_111265 [Hydnomerulius pinastri MD-312]
MSFPPPTQFDCPTLEYLSVDPPSIEKTSASTEATKWLTEFATSVSINDPLFLTTLFHELGYWKDILALTWDFRTIRGSKAIKQLLDARLSATCLTAFRLVDDQIHKPVLVRLIPGVVFVRFRFDFETRHGRGNAVAFLIPTRDGNWRAWSLFTRLESLKEFPEKIGVLRDHVTHHDGLWADRLQRETDFVDADPTVLIIGAGHGGLEMAARLKCMGVSTLVIDRSTRIGDSWRKRYKTLCLHDTVWYNRMPYLDFPKTWPVYCPASKLGDWLELYAKALELNVWLSSSPTQAEFNEETQTWHVPINRAGEVRALEVKHIIFATGFGGGFPNTPKIPGKELYSGTVLHSSEFSSAAEYGGKKVIVVGAGNSAHDIALDLCHYGSDVTMIQRSPTYVISVRSMAAVLGDRYNEHFPVDSADLLSVALPYASTIPLLKVAVDRMASTTDRDIIEGLERAGFRTYLGPDGAGLVPLIYKRGGGFYIDTGASQEIINGNIKVKSGCSIQGFTQHGLELEGGVEVDGDVIVFATGFGDIRDSVREVCGSEVADRVGPVWGMNEEGELQGVWRRTGQPRLWLAMGNLARSRLHSLHLALQIKAIEEGILDDADVYTD